MLGVGAPTVSTGQGMMALRILLVPFVQRLLNLNLIDTHIAVAISHCFFNVPITIWILEGFMSSVPCDLDDTTRADGYGIGRFSGSPCHRASRLGS